MAMSACPSCELKCTGQEAGSRCRFALRPFIMLAIIIITITLLCLHIKQMEKLMFGSCFFFPSFCFIGSFFLICGKGKLTKTRSVWLQSSYVSHVSL